MTSSYLVCAMFIMFCGCCWCIVWMHRSQSEQLWLNVIFYDYCFFVTQFGENCISLAWNEVLLLAHILSHLVLRNLCLFATATAAVELYVLLVAQKFHAPKQRKFSKTGRSIGKNQNDSISLGGISIHFWMKSENYEKLDHTNCTVEYQTKWKSPLYVHRWPSVNGYFYLLALIRSTQKKKS